MFDKQALQRVVSKAASHYDEFGIFQAEIGGRLLERLALIKLKPVRILDLGCGTGFISQALQASYPKAQHYACDFNDSMLQVARAKLGCGVNFINADAEALPLHAATFDLIVTNLLLPWVDCEIVLAEVRRLLKPGGVLLFSTLGPDTLQEIRDLWQHDDKPHVHEFIDMHHLGDLLQQLQFIDPVVEMEHLSMRYRRVADLLQDLKHTGSTNVSHNRRKPLTGKHRWQTFVAAFEQQFDHDERLTVTAEIIYGHALGNALPLQQTNEAGEVLVSLESLR